MHKDKADLLVAALRSGEYKQGHGKLTKITHEGEFDCCLGVACKVAMKHGVPLRVRRDDPRIAYIHVFYDEATNYAPLAVQDFFGFGAKNPVTNERGHGAGSLAELNDGGYTFEQIADIIERDWEIL
jgi:hypothetical protein